MSELTIFSILILIFSVVIHEVAHGYAALFQGDLTAKYAGRLTLNPLKHLDPLGSIVFPLITSLSGVTFGWAKPVPFNPYNLRNKRWGEAIVAVAGPLSNLALALIFGLLVRYGMTTGALPIEMIRICGVITVVNLSLAVFNLLPVAPLDGSKILFALVPVHRVGELRAFMERYSIVFLLVFIFILWKFVSPIIFVLFTLITGLSGF